MINKTLMTAGAFILSMMLLLAATNINAQQVGEQDRDQDRDRHALAGIVVDADTEEGIPNATVYIKKKNGEDGMQTDRTQQQQDQQQQQQQQQDRAAEHGQDELESTTTDHNGEFEFDNLGQLLTQGAQAGTQQQQQQQQQDQQQQEHERDNDETFILVVEAEGYETEEKEIKLSDYLDRQGEHGAMDRDQDRDREYDTDQDMDRDRDDDKDKDKDKIKIELTRSN